MKLSQIVIGFVSCLSLALTSQAATLTTLDWQFSEAGNPAAPTAAATINPSGGTATATFLGNNNTYTFGSGEFGLYGSPTGLWDIQNGQLELGMDRTSTSPVDYTLVLTHFFDSSVGFFPGTVIFSITNAQFVGRTTVVPQTGIMVGSWVADTYQWSALSLAGPILLGISPGAGSGQLLFDEVKLSIVGDLTAVVNVPPTLFVQLSGNAVMLTWSGPFVLQSASNPAGPYADVPGASSPWLVDPATNSMRFFRLRSEP